MHKGLDPIWAHRLGLRLVACRSREGGRACLRCNQCAVQSSSMAGLHTPSAAQHGRDGSSACHWRAPQPGGASVMHALLHAVLPAIPAPIRRGFSGTFPSLFAPNSALSVLPGATMLHDMPRCLQYVESDEGSIYCMAANTLYLSSRRVSVFETAWC